MVVAPKSELAPSDRGDVPVVDLSESRITEQPHAQIIDDRPIQTKAQTFDELLRKELGSNKKRSPVKNTKDPEDEEAIEVLPVKRQDRSPYRERMFESVKSSPDKLEPTVPKTSRINISPVSPGKKRITKKPFLVKGGGRGGGKGNNKSVDFSRSPARTR